MCIRDRASGDNRRLRRRLDPPSGREGPAYRSAPRGSAAAASAAASVVAPQLRVGADPAWEFSHETITWREQVGVGGNGSVFKVTQSSFTETHGSSFKVMAAKQIFIKGAEREKAQKMLRRELRAMQLLDHKNIVKVHGVCINHNDWVCLLMELMPRSLRMLLDTEPETATGSEATQLKLAHGIAAGIEQ